MIIELTTNQATDMLLADTNANWTPSGARALAEYLDENMDEDYTFNVVDVRCEWTEYGSLEEAYKEHYGDDSDLPEDQRRTEEDEMREYLEDNTHIIEFDGRVTLPSGKVLGSAGVIVQEF